MIGRSGVRHTNGEEPTPVPRHRRSILARTTYDCIERSGETGLDRTLIEARDAFMAMKGIDRAAFEAKYGAGSGYGVWRKFAADYGLELPV